MNGRRGFLQLLAASVAAVPFVGKALSTKAGPAALPASKYQHGRQFFTTPSYASRIEAMGVRRNWSVAAGELPPGMTLAAQTGVIYGTPTTAGTYAVTLQARDDQGNTECMATSIDTQRVHPLCQ